MPPEIHSYAVFGFSENLNWSTLHFVKPIDDIRVCSACRVVARKAAFLPCRHVLCQPCYEQWKPRVKVCFLDGDLCPESEVHWRVFPVERMMKSEVSCWNRANGCETITDVSRIADHFHRDCEYHTTCCPECSSTVLRRDIIAHLESHCVQHVLNRESSTPPREGVFKEVEDIREGLRCLELTFRNASTNTACLLSSPPSITANHEANLQPLLKMEVEVKQISQVMEQASSAMEERSQTRLDHIAALKAFGACLSAELDEMKRAADEWASCETTAAHCVGTEREEHVENLKLLQRDLRSVSSKLEQLNKLDTEALIAKSVTAKDLSEALRCHVSTGRVEVPGGGFAVGATARVFENVLKLPIEVVWSVNNWSKLTHAIKAYEFLLCYTDIAVDNRYRIRLSMKVRTGRWFEFQAQVYETNGTTLAASPKKMKLNSVNARAWCVEREINASDAGLGDQRSWEFLSGDFGVEDLEASGSIRHDKLNFGFTIFY